MKTLLKHLQEAGLPSPPIQPGSRVPPSGPGRKRPAFPARPSGRPTRRTRRPQTAHAPRVWAPSPRPSVSVRRRRRRRRASKVSARCPGSHTVGGTWGHGAGSRAVEARAYLRRRWGGPGPFTGKSTGKEALSSGPEGKRQEAARAVVGSEEDAAASLPLTPRPPANDLLGQKAFRPGRSARPRPSLPNTFLSP